uniref:Uncharacterized protein n=1 Tax=Kalanchoe fedtschenkoi TaxID=63787 RepID=A0A7N0T301_KALFE
MPTTEDGNQVPWTTWEELLLTFAVKRHGCRNWDSVATEIQTRTSLPASPEACRLKFHDLRRRFASQNDDDDDDDLTVPWAEDLRRLRLDELRAEVNRHDLSISSLQLKVKKLEQDRDQSLKEEEEDSALKPDLEPSNNHHLEPVDRHADRESDPENQSVNGSNSTGPDKAKNRGSGQKEVDSTRPGSDHKTEPLPPGSKQNASSTSSSSSDESSAKGLSIDLQKNHEAEAGTKTGSDVQSSATLSSKRRREKEALEADGGLTAESQPLVNVLTLLRSHKDSSLFEQRLQNQETEKQYINVVRQHMDLQTIQHNLDSGSYTSSHLSFFRDLLLMFTNSIIFLPKSSPEFKAAEELRSIVANQMDERFKSSRRDEEKPSSTPPSPGTKPILEKSDPLLAKHKSSGGGPIVVCRKRSSKSNSARKGEPQSDIGDDMKTVALADLNPASPKEEPSLLSSKTKNRIVTGTRSLRRSNTNLKNHVTLPSAADGTGTSNSSKKETANTTAATTNEKKEELSALKKDDTSAKKKGAADFLKRLKGNSPVKSRDVKSEAKSSAAKGNNSSTASGEQKKKSGHGEKQADGRKKMATRQSDLGKQSSKTERATSPAKRNVGRPSKKTLEPIAPAIKRGRDTEASASTASKQPKKRIRR